MKIILTQEDLDTAVYNHITTLGMDLTGKSVDIDFTAGRGVNGNTATVDIVPMKNGEAPAVEDIEVMEQPIEDNSEQMNLFDEDS